MPRILCVALSFVLSAGSIIGQEAPPQPQPGETSPIEITNYREAWKHRLTPRTSIRRPQAKANHLFDSEELKIVVDRDGNVISAKPERNADEFTEAALFQARGWKYKPFEKNGKPVSATFIDYVAILPPLDVPKVHVPFPPIRDWNSLKIRLERTVCYGSCPSYAVEIAGDGSVLYNGTAHVVVTGTHHAHISKDAVEQMVEAFRKADYFSLRDSYVYGVTDNPTYKTSISFDDHTKSVRDYVGLQVGMPEAVTDIEDLIDRLAGTERWIAGNATTLASLAEEGWDFNQAMKHKQPNPQLLLARLPDFDSAPAWFLAPPHHPPSPRLSQMCARPGPRSMGAHRLIPPERVICCSAKLQACYTETASHCYNRVFS